MPQRNALLVGIDRYSGSKFKTLEYVADDVLGMQRVLSTYNSQYSCQLLDGDASYKDIRRGFKELIEKSADDAVLIFYFAGHAAIASGGVYFITKDNEEEIEDGLNFQYLAEIVRNSKRSNQSIIMLLDCCHAGSLSPTPDAILSKIGEVLHSVSVSIIAATESHSKAYEDDGYKHGIFTYWLIKGLEGRASNEKGEVTESTLYEYVAQEINNLGKQKVVHKSISIGGSPVLSSGHPPQQKTTKIVSESKIQDFRSTVKRALESLDSLRNVPQDVWQNSNYDLFCNKLSLVLSDKKKFLEEFPDKNDIFTEYQADILRLRMYASDIHVGYKTKYGEVVRIIGEGGFGTVYELQNNSERRAYKVYHSNQFNEIDKVRAFWRGYRAMQRLSHPNIVKVYDISEAPLGFIMDYIDGDNLRKVWFDENEPIKMLDLLYQISLIIDYSHTTEFKVIHRDIKPENILVVENSDGIFVPYLTDFDLAWYSTATQYSRIADPNIVFGHYIYGAPEQINKPNAEITRQPTADIYSFGQLAYFIVCGKDPIMSNDKTKLATQDLQARLERWTVADAVYEFVEFYNSCVKDNPKDRIQTMAEVSERIRSIKTLLVDPDATVALTKETFLKQIVFSLFGLGKHVTDSFFSHSERTSIHLSDITNQKIEIKFAIETGYSSQTGKFETQRETLTRYLDTALNKYRNTLKPTRHTETGDVYACTVILKGNYLNYRNTNDIVSLIKDIIHELEK